MNEHEKEDYIGRLVSLKSFAELTAAELAFVMDEIGSEEQYVSLQRIHKMLESSSPSKLNPDARTLGLLQERFSQQHARPSLWHRIALATIPAYAMVVALLFVSILTWAITAANQEVKIKTVMVAQQKDTVHVFEKGDTVFVKKVVYKYVKVKNEPPVSFILASFHHNLSSDSTLSVSMKEKEELDNLLVTGVN